MRPGPFRLFVTLPSLDLPRQATARTAHPRAKRSSSLSAPRARPVTPRRQSPALPAAPRCALARSRAAARHRGRLQGSGSVYRRVVATPGDAGRRGDVRLGIRYSFARNAASMARSTSRPWSSRRHWHHGTGHSSRAGTDHPRGAARRACPAHCPPGETSRTGAGRTAFPGTGRHAPGPAPAAARRRSARRRPAWMLMRLPGSRQMAAQHGHLSAAGQIRSCARPARRTSPGICAVVWPDGSVPGEDRDPVAVLRGHRQLCDHRVDARRLGLVLGPQLTAACLWIAAGGSVCGIITSALTRKPNKPQPYQPPQPSPAGAVCRDGAAAAVINGQRTRHAHRPP
jgi:hypothetical protein